MNEDIERYYTKGKYLVVVYNQSANEAATVSEIRETYSYLKEIQQNK